jgi:CheY-like chemotaxis protein
VKGDSVYEATPHSKTVLVVEDNNIAREGLALVLRRRGYNVAVAADGAEALESLRRGPHPDVILLDMLLPVLDGWDFLQERKHHPALANIPVVITTALSIADQEWAESLGADGYLRKPIEVGVLLDAIRRHC